MVVVSFKCKIGVIVNQHLLSRRERDRERERDERERILQELGRGGVRQILVKCFTFVFFGKTFYIFWLEFYN